MKTEKLVNLNDVLEKQKKQVPRKLFLKNNHIPAKELIRQELEKGYHLSKLQMLNKFGCWNSGEVIRKLRTEGNDIKTEMIRHEVTGKRFAVYYLTKK